MVPKPTDLLANKLSEVENHTEGSIGHRALADHIPTLHFKLIPNGNILKGRMFVIPDCWREATLVKYASEVFINTPSTAT